MLGEYSCTPYNSLGTAGPSPVTRVVLKVRVAVGTLARCGEGLPRWFLMATADSVPAGSVELLLAWWEVRCAHVPRARYLPAQLPNPGLSGGKGVRNPGGRERVLWGGDVCHPREASQTPISLQYPRGAETTGRGTLGEWV